MAEDSSLKSALEQKFPEKVRPGAPEKIPVRTDKGSVELIARPEGAPGERGPENRLPADISESRASGAASVLATLSVQKKEKEREKKIEAILEDGLIDFYKDMTPDQQKAFKEKGEETTRRINELFRDAKFRIMDVIDLIRKWLMMIPGVNKFFLEQEAKLKADKIIELKALEDIDKL